MTDAALDIWGNVENSRVPANLIEFHRKLIECDDQLSNHLGPTTPLRTEIRRLLKEISDRY